MEVSAQPVGRWWEPLALRALLYITFGIIKYLGPIVSLVDNFVGKGTSSHVVPTVAIVDFLHHFSSFVRTKTS